MSSHRAAQRLFSAALHGHRCPEVGGRGPVTPFWLTLLFLFPYPLQALPFSHLILATGSTGPFPGKCNEVSCQQAAIQAYEDMVKQVCHTDGCESARGHSRGSGREIVRGHQCWITSLGGSKSCYSEILSELLCVLCWCITHRLVSPVTSG